MFSFGLMTDISPRLGEQARFAEEQGFGYYWLIDSPVNWREMAPYLTMAVMSTEKSIIGACCTNPVTRNPMVNASMHATLQELSGGRVVLGIGKGDSAVRRMGERPAKLSELKKSAPLMQQLASGEEVAYVPERPADESWYQQATEDETLELEWAPKKKMPLYVAGYGPKILEWSGEVADGIFMQIAEPTTVAWAIEHLKKGANKADRDVRDIDIVLCVPSVINDDHAAACDAVRGFPAFVSNHVMDLLRYYDPSDLPDRLVASVEGKEVYDYRHHTESGAEHSSAISDELTDAYTVIGTTDQIVEKLRQLKDVGASQLCIYFFGIEEDEMFGTIKTYSEEIIPRVNAV